MINKLSRNFAVRIKKAAPDSPQSVEVLKYALSAILNTFFIIGFSLIVSLFTGKLSEVIIVLIGFALLRQVSGGFHLKSGTWCIIVSTLGITLISFADFGQAVSSRITVIALILALIFAPSRIEKQTRIPAKYFPILKLLSILIVSTNFALHFPVLSTAFLVQGLTLIRRRG
ncbi:accessory gene regulator ArgB-like protein [Cohnella sp. AR92]|uniref:accessory gene regulator ArgB-like protein n=1 Tax=Cohnella sp. AR92 TaxID=648716 RepID=UPI000F8CB783|nr:accessory gene regulator B family protein [Cohnella sp. AR92]RUS44596.1 accessory regulator AgrB [Cohnella sp. AR92]